MHFIDYDPFYGISTYHKRDGNKDIFVEVQDIEPFKDLNKSIASNLDKKKNFWVIGEIPLNICHQWSIECGHKMFSKEWQEYSRKKLNDSDYRNFNQAKVKL